MADAMWQQPAVQSNVQLLCAWGAHFLGPVSGTVASGDRGQRMMEPVQIAAEIAGFWDALA
jgi:phosphopantothenoylcysteine synthetase/decarboxylase